MYIAWMSFDPDSIFLIIPYVNMPLTWYGVLFAFGFLVGYHIFIHMFRIYLAVNNEIVDGDIQEKGLKEKRELSHFAKMRMREIDMHIKTNLPEQARPLTKIQRKLLRIISMWRGKDAETFLYHRVQWENRYPEVFTPLVERAKLFSERGVLYVIIATVLGARLGHILFYENPIEYLMHPLDILKTWEGGLASHGAIAAILAAVWLFTRRAKASYPEFSFTKMMDFLSVPILFVCGMIRIGNFFNQEILGVETTLPWAIIFGHPADGSLAIPRHPVQIYEAIFYFSWFVFLYSMWRKNQERLEKGRIVGLALMGSFAFRFFVEYVKTEQSVWMPEFSESFLMGQVLSIPMVLVGVAFYFYQPFRKRALSK